MNTLLAKIYKTSTKFLEPLDPDKTYQLIVEEAIKLVGASHGSIFLMQNNRLVRLYASSPVLYKINIRKHGFTYKTFKDNQIYISNRQQNQQAHPITKLFPSESVVYIPLSYKNKSIGVLNLGSLKEESFSRQEIEMLRFFASLATLAIRKTQLYDETKKALEMRDLFISMASHELRTPLTTISGYAQLLQNKFQNDDSVEAGWVKQLYYEAIRLAKLINELLEINRIKKGIKLDLHLSECNMEQVMQRAITNFKFSYPHREVIFKNNLSEKEDIVIGDFDKLIQIITNVLDNAAKYSLPGTKIVIELSFKPPHIIVSIKDRGKGIEEKDLPKVIERYYKVDHTDQKGIGIGLFLVKNFLDRHNGDLKIYSKLGKGTIVNLKFPRIKI